MEKYTKKKTQKGFGDIVCEEDEAKEDVDG